MRNIWTIRFLTLALWLLAAASASYWLIQTTARAAPHPALAQATVAGQAGGKVLQPDTLAVARGLGALGDVVVIASVADGGASVDWNPSRFALSGIVAQGSEKDGLVMLSVDGKPAQILQVGATVEPNVVVQALSRQSVTLANISQPDAPVLLTLKLGEHNKTTNAQADSSPAAPAAAALGGNQAPAFPPVSAAQTQQAPGFPSVSAAAAAAQAATAPAFPAPAAAPEAAAPAAESAADAERDARRARLAERLEQRRAANATNGNNANSAANAANAANGNKANNASNNAPAPTPRRSVLSEDNLYFGD